MNELAEKSFEFSFLAETPKEFDLNSFMGETECVFKKCCKKWKKKGKHCKKCPEK
ncbi:hypothetical protein LX87_03220 [Larkinella arboricola]|uniref:Uncharacterized protein n=1 Tax=Larkinella arboricola TaxID=643671 RepID=A0A327WT21_LARAB|nr:hypothetical protein LX87_03220 [Larkinella arboricola]